MIQIGQVMMQWVFCFFSVVTFGIITNVPHKYLVNCGLIGSSVWVLFYFMKNLNIPIMISYFVAAFLIRFLSFVSAKWRNGPSVCFTVPSIVTIVPGSLSYRMIRSFVQGDINQSVNDLESIFGIVIAISIGFLLAEVLFKRSQWSLENLKKWLVHR